MHAGYASVRLITLTENKQTVEWGVTINTSLRWLGPVSALSSAGPVPSKQGQHDKIV